MKQHLLSLLAAALFLAAPLFAADTGQLLPASKADAAWLEKARASYPLKVCVVSDEELGSMGDAPERIYRVKGQPDRLVLFCCDGCEEDFKAEPARFLARIDAAKNAKDPAKKEKSAHAH